jgi:hypothetical protein
MREAVRRFACVMVCIWVAGCPLPKPPPVNPGGGDGSDTPDPVAFDPTSLRALESARLAQIARLPLGPIKVINACFKPAVVDPATVDVDRSLFVHDHATLEGAVDFSLKRTLAKLASDAVAAGATGATAQTLFHDLWNLQNPPACNGTINGLPDECRPFDGAQATAANLDAEIAAYHPIGIVNRLDLAAEGWANCGEHRIVYGRRGTDPARSFMIFEAVLPNPRPGCESGCRAVANHWYQLSSIADPVERARRLEQLFYTGLPGYQPVVRVDHYAAKTSGGYAGGSGQIRTNQFLRSPINLSESPWMLKEFKLAIDCSSAPCQLSPTQIPVKVNPDGHLWTEASAGPAHDFQSNTVLPQVSDLAINDINKFSYQVPLPFDAARSDPQTGGIQDDYPEAYTSVPGVPGGFRASLVAAAATTSPVLTDRQLVNRATAMSCAGCHQPGTFGLTSANAIGPGVSWPASASFVHVKAEENASGIHVLSAALTGTFLPHRADNLAAMLSDQVCACRIRKLPFDTVPIETRVFSTKPTSLVDIASAEQNLKREIDAEVVRRSLPPLPSAEPPSAIETLDLAEVKAAGRDPTARASALRTAVQKLVQGEPPRKTVTGHFRVE